MEPRLYSLVKYDFNSLPESWRKEHPTNLYEGIVFVYFGEIPNMKGHCYVQDIKTGKGYIFHPFNVIELNEEEI